MKGLFLKEPDSTKTMAEKELEKLLKRRSITEQRVRKCKFFIDRLEVGRIVHEDLKSELEQPADYEYFADEPVTHV